MKITEYNKKVYIGAYKDIWNSLFGSAYYVYPDGYKELPELYFATGNFEIYRDNGLVVIYNSYRTLPEILKYMTDNPGSCKYIDRHQWCHGIYWEHENIDPKRRFYFVPSDLANEFLKGNEQNCICIPSEEICEEYSNSYGKGIYGNYIVCENEVICVIISSYDNVTFLIR